MQTPMKNVRKTIFVNRYSDDEMTLNIVSYIQPRTVRWFQGNLWRQNCIELPKHMKKFIVKTYEKVASGTWI